MALKQCLAALAMGAVLSACGGGGGAGAAPAPAVQPSTQSSIGTAGVFNVGYGQFSGVYAFLDNGAFYGLHFVGGGELAGHPHGVLKAQDSLKAMEPIAWANFIDDARMVGAQEQSGMFGRVFTATKLDVAISGSMGEFKASSSSQRLLYGNTSTKTVYNDPVALSDLAGTYAGNMRTVGFNETMAFTDTMTIDKDGNVSANVINCTFKGTIVQHGKTGIYDAVFQTSGDQCAVRDTFKGIAMPLEIIGTAPRLAFELDTADNLKTAVFIVTRK